LFKIFATAFSFIVLAVLFSYWILSIFLIAVIHEFSHGVVGRAWKLKIKSSGFAFLSILVPVIPAAFVEPDEKQTAKASARAQLGMLSAGPFSNVVFAALILLSMTRLNHGWSRSIAFPVLNQEMNKTDPSRRLFWVTLGDWLRNEWA